MLRMRSTGSRRSAAPPRPRAGRRRSRRRRTPRSASGRRSTPPRTTAPSTARRSGCPSRLSRRHDRIDVEHARFEHDVRVRVEDRSPQRARAAVRGAAHAVDVDAVHHRERRAERVGIVKARALRQAEQRRRSRASGRRRASDSRMRSTPPCSTCVGVADEETLHGTCYCHRERHAGHDDHSGLQPRGDAARSGGERARADVSADRDRHRRRRLDRRHARASPMRSRASTRRSASSISRTAASGRAREAGRLAARGEFIQHLDSDDLLLPAQVRAAGGRAAARIPNAARRTAGRAIIDRDGRCARHRRNATGERIETMFPAMLRVALVGHADAALPRVAAHPRRAVAADLRIEEDWEYDARIAARGVRLHYVDDVGLRSETSRGRTPVRARHAIRMCCATAPTAHALIYRACAARRHRQPTRRRCSTSRASCSCSRGSAAPRACRDESQQLFSLARDASGPDRESHSSSALYARSRRVFGWSLTGQLACLSDRLRW